MTDAEIDGRLMAVVRQRDNAMNEVVILSGEIAKLKSEMAEKNEKVTKMPVKA